MFDTLIQTDNLDIGFKDGLVAAMEPDLCAAEAGRRIDARGAVVAPGLIDLHTHVYHGGTALGVEADGLSLRGGTTTFVDAGSAGAGNIEGFRRHVIERTKVRILAYLNVSFAGIFGFSRRVMVGECADLRLCDARSCRDAAREHADVLVGIKARVGRNAGGASGVAPLDIALEVAEDLGLPVMAHIDEPPPSLKEVVERLRPGDVLTHCCRPFPSHPLTRDGHIRPEILAARARGVVFDVGHGMGSLDFDTARGMLAADFPPDVISSDVHALNVDGPAFDLLVTMSKFLCLGMSLEEVIRRATETPARAIARPNLGFLKVGAAGDAAVLRVEEGRFDYRDVMGQRLDGSKRIVCDALVVGGR